MKKRRFGTITTRSNGRHYVQVTVPSPESGDSRRVSLGGFATRAEAERALARSVVDREQGLFTAPDSRTLGGFLTNEWLPSIERDVRPTTLANNRAIIGAYIALWPIARRRLSDLTEIEIKRHYNRLAERGGKDGRPLSSKTILHVHTVIRRALEDAVRSNLIPRSPAPKRRPRVERTERAWLTADQMAVILSLARVREFPLYPALRLAALAGLRRGELAGLRWSDVDLNYGTVTIRRTRTVAHGRVVEGPTKTSESSASITVDSRTRDALSSLREARTALIERPPESSEYLFVTPMSASALPDPPDLGDSRPGPLRPPWWALVIIGLLVAVLVLGVAYMLTSEPGPEKADPTPKATSVQPSPVETPSSSLGSTPSANVEVDLLRAKCIEDLGKLMESLRELDSRLSVGLTFEQYTEKVADARVAYDRIRFKSMDRECILAAGVSAEDALNLYVRANSVWNRCIGNFGCDLDSIDPALQRFWRKADREITQAQRGLNHL